MTQDQFVYWLQGFVELTEVEQPSKAQWAAIKAHLQLVFTKVTPDLGKPWPELKPAPLPFPANPGIRTMELRPSDQWPNFGKPGWLTQQDGTPWPPGTILC